jgi:hypothetical protein
MDLNPVSDIRCSVFIGAGMDYGLEMVKSTVFPETRTCSAQVVPPNLVSMCSAHLEG